MRLDQLLVDRGLVTSRNKAQSLVMAGCVFEGDRRLDKPGQMMPAGAVVFVRGPDHPWVSRGGVKLAYGLECFSMNPHALVALDVGASTGGFTDVLLAGGAARVYAVDVGYGQLAMRLRLEPRVVVLERTNARYLSAAHVPEPIDLVVCDASFIGLRTLLPAPLSLTRPGAQLVALIKPQFEVGREQVGRGGVVRDAQAQATACARITVWLAGQPGWRVLGVVESPLTGPNGNREFLVGAVRDGDDSLPTLRTDPEKE